MAFRSFRSQGGTRRIAEVEPTVEQFVLNDKDGAATVFHCPACGQDENYLVVVGVEGGIAWTVFQLSTFKVDAYRDTLRAVMASVEFTAIEDEAEAAPPPLSEPLPRRVCYFGEFAHGSRHGTSLARQCSARRHFPCAGKVGGWRVVPCSASRRPARMDHRAICHAVARGRRSARRRTCAWP